MMLLTVFSVGSATSTRSAAATTAAATRPPRQPRSTDQDTTAAAGQMPGTVLAPAVITSGTSTHLVARIARTASASSVPTMAAVRERRRNMAAVQASQGLAMV